MSFASAYHSKNFSPKNRIVIEDSPNGIAAAKNAGCFCIALTKTRSVTELNKADLIVPAAELEHAINQIILKSHLS
ncbi:HAD family phosphatase [Silvanigrella aquatica]|uniref:HAD family hydrolase n=1 Tax=Silvanigrella aquatica TaxID=1915309 RepID=A0A1L4D2C3_9BACT|nr:HAD family phosphatase [Silvanigrella aquatica]APJ04346.1 hypothetical protein AXG55_10685 [Silvanigrella aquatica]